MEEESGREREEFIEPRNQGQSSVADMPVMDLLYSSGVTNWYLVAQISPTELMGGRGKYETKASRLSVPKS